MKQKINICKKNENGTLTVIDEKVMIEQMDGDLLEVCVIYKKQRYIVQGNCYMSYIVIKGDE